MWFWKASTVKLTAGLTPMQPFMEPIKTRPLLVSHMMFLISVLSRLIFGCHINYYHFILYLSQTFILIYYKLTCMNNESCLKLWENKNEKKRRDETSQLIKFNFFELDKFRFLQFYGGYLVGLVIFYTTHKFYTNFLLCLTQH